MSRSTLLAALGLAVPMGGVLGSNPSRLTLMGRASVKINSGAGAVLYVDPYAKGDYSEPADLILVTHGHGDHNKTSLPARNPGCAVIAPKGAVPDKDAIHLSEYSSTTIAGVKITALPAYNANHPRGSCVGYLLEFGGIRVYHAGDTSLIPEMSGLKKQNLDYALLPCDGKYNMGPEEATRAAAAVGARFVVPIHSSGDGMETGPNASKLTCPGLQVLQAGHSLTLEASERD
ncbi:MAG: MBL fold metallo-hydrolase [Spirochaetales bacterium]|nr:MBL fold metallo-hydrolase [Spirochaetales bacterium]